LHDFALTCLCLGSVHVDHDVIVLRAPRCAGDAAPVLGDANGRHDGGGAGWGAMLQHAPIQIIPL